jgi:adsorption protein B
LGEKQISLFADSLILVEHLQRELMLLAAVGFLIGSGDELIVDILWIGRYIWRRIFVYSRYRATTGLTVPPSLQPGCIAVFVPAWDESEVIGPMLRHCLKCWQGDNFHLFVGCYSNDPATMAEVVRMAAEDQRILPVLSSQPGPTTKGDCLNSIWAALRRQEAAQGFRFKAIVLHDAEDVVHPAEIRLFDAMIDRFDLVQIPVFPLVDRNSRWVSGHYCDEFAEAHGKYLTVREAVGAAMPSAGVGCAFSRECMGRIAAEQNDAPFDPACLTEDYELGLRVGELGGQGVFVRMPDGQGGTVCTREYFPARLDAAVKQKARWMTGIALAGWDRMGWHGSLAERWMRLRDRRSPLAAIILCVGYAAILLYGIVSVAHWWAGTAPRPFSEPLMTLLLANGLLLLWRIGIRWAFVTRFYGWREGMRSIPRNFVANIITIMAARRAVSHYARIRRGVKPVWEKTSHHFPEELVQAS